MPRDHARIHLDIWGNDDWRDLSPEAQHLYFVLYSWPPSMCGSGDWQPRKIQARARGWSVEKVLDAAEELVAGEFILIDFDTEEYLIRSWIKHDGLYKVQNMAVAINNARSNLASRTLRGVVVHEVLKLKAAEPKLDSWNRPAVAKMLEQKPINPSEVEWSSPWDRGSDSPSDRGTVSPKATGEASPSVSTSPTPLLPTPSPSSRSQESASRGSRIPDGWVPSPDVIAQMRSDHPHIDHKVEHEKFLDYWRAQPGAKGRKSDWDATWRNWIRRAAENTKTGSKPRIATSDQRVMDVQALKHRNPGDPPRLELA
ncbi:hypothetical protein AB4Z39_10665 [Mycobacterium adipatum]|uniref:hypothetical protein n=1 Tax=Mycobacterium adipatum TaxID=1682113 RepID=UPI0034E0B015